MNHNEIVEFEVNIDSEQLARKWKFFFLLGITLGILGLGGIIFSVSMTLTTMIFFGVLLLVAGLSLMFTGIKGETSLWMSKKAQILLGLAYLLLALIFLLDPFGAAMGLTLLVAFWLGIIGVGRILQYFQMKKTHAAIRSRLFQGVLNLLLGLILVFSWPISGLWAIGIFVGVELLVQGNLLVAFSLLMKKHLQQKKVEPIA